MKVLPIPNGLYEEEDLPGILKREYVIHRVLESYEDAFRDKNCGLVNDNSYFIKIYNVIRLKDAFVVYMDYIFGYSLDQFITQINDIKIYKNNEVCENIFKDMDRRFYVPLFLRLIEGLSIIHDAGVVHLDVATRNIMCDKGDIKYIDFGESCFFASNKELNQKSLFDKVECKENNIEASIKIPEMIIYDSAKIKIKYMKDVDVWDLGGVMLSLATQTHDYKIISVYSIHQNLLRYYDYKKLSPKSKDIIDKVGSSNYKTLNKINKINVLYKEYAYQNKKLFDNIKDVELRKIIRDVATGKHVKLSVISKKLRDLLEIKLTKTICEHNACIKKSIAFTKCCVSRVCKEHYNLSQRQCELCKDK